MTEIEFIAALGGIVIVAGIMMSAVTYMMVPRPARKFHPNWSGPLPEMRPGETVEEFWNRVEDGDV